MLRWSLLTFVLVRASGLALAADPRVVVALGSTAVIGSVTVENEDLAVCSPSALGAGTTSCTWQLLFDGSAAGLNSSVKAVDLLPNGHLVMTVATDGSIPDLSAIKRKDLALFIPNDPFTLPYTSGEWRLYLDGDAVKGASDARIWDAMAVLTDGSCENEFPPTCDVLLSLSGGATLGGVAFSDEDILKCTPTGWSAGGSITSCAYSLFLDSSAINGGGAGSFTGNLFGFDVVQPDTLIFRGPGQATLPAHDSQRDLLRYVGSFGETPAGSADILFDGNTAGLGGETVQAMAVVSEACGDGVVNPPFEACDLGALNGLPASGCDATCRLVGRCTGSGAFCATAADCPVGEGCCGNNVVEGLEECDDGNTYADDTCSSTCAIRPDGIPLVGCANALGPHVIPGFVRKTALRRTGTVVSPGFDRWKSRGDFNLPGDTSVDPATEVTQVTFNQTSAILYQATVVPGLFTRNRNTWRLFSLQADLPLALGLRKAKLAQKLNKVSFTLDGRYVAIPVDPTQPIALRQSLHIGNDCITTVLSCTPNSSGTSLKCVPAPPP
jgi:cysteine-rich repeat protein